ncbi:hypothetical protein B0H14DRAFT_2988656 [Mycena olivaceomarginata]|nr:hypothetical protein B0H14DRAFT_2988656 [Mycena olivaceomarginata]
MYRMGSARRRTRGYPNSRSAVLRICSVRRNGGAAEGDLGRKGKGKADGSTQARGKRETRQPTAHGVQAVNSPLSVSSAAREMGGGEATRAIALSMGSLAFRKAAAPQVPIAGTHRSPRCIRGGGGWASGQRKEGGEGRVHVSRVRTEAGKNKHGMERQPAAGRMRLRFEIKCSCAARWT